MCSQPGRPIGDIGIILHSHTSRRAPSLHSDSCYSNFAQHRPGFRTGEMSVKLPAAAPETRPVFRPIAPKPMNTPSSIHTKGPRGDDECVELSEQRPRSESNTFAQFELTEEDRLLLRLKDEDSMPWKDTTARFQNVSGKQYKITALQMRLRRP